MHLVLGFWILLVPFLCCAESILFSRVVLLSWKKKKKERKYQITTDRNEVFGLFHLTFISFNSYWQVIPGTQNPEGGAVFIRVVSWREEEGEEEEGLWVEMSLAQWARYLSESSARCKVWRVPVCWRRSVWACSIGWGAVVCLQRCVRMCVLTYMCMF